MQLALIIDQVVIINRFVLTLGPKLTLGCQHRVRIIDLICDIALILFVKINGDDSSFAIFISISMSTCFTVPSVFP